jgi:hypothetical protein
VENTYGHVRTTEDQFVNNESLLYEGQKIVMHLENNCDGSVTLEVVQILAIYWITVMVENSPTAHRGRHEYCAALLCTSVYHVLRLKNRLLSIVLVR